MNTSKVLEDGKAKVEGLTLPVIWERTQPTSIGFADTAKRLWNADVNWRTAMAYDATQAIAQGLENAQTREGLKATLGTKGFSANGANGSIQFLPSGDRQMDDPKTAPTTPTLVKVEKGSTGYEFKRIPPKGTEPNNYPESAQPTLP
jgi:branched-chain amino acid transport system substrate-binding protein